jgi:tripartite-type tricarboxylate transporter receptor subunit TctC
LTPSKSSLVPVLALLAMAASAQAQSFPTRPITIVVPYAAGGPVDTYARLLGEHMRGSLGQPIVIENVTGASGTIGVGRVARAAPDGYTLSMGNFGSHVVNGAIYSLTYDLLEDLAPVALHATSSQLIIARGSMPADDLAGLIAWLKANPDKASAGTGGTGSPQHVGGVFFQNATGTRFQLVPYRGAAPAMQDLLAGQIDLMIDPPTNSLPHVRRGSIKAYAVTGPSRLPSAPDIPTVDEAGLPGFYFRVWHATWAPKSTPRPVIERLNAAVVGALADPAVRARLVDLGQSIVPREQQTPEALAMFQKAEIERWWPILKAANIKGE